MTAHELSSLNEAKAATVSGPTILLSSGKYFNFERPDECEFDIEDIACGLANTCRFGGQCSEFYSVAEHSVYVSMLVPEELRWYALMHDAAEAFIGDMPKPLKEILPDYKTVEQRVEAAVADRFGLPHKMPPEIKRADIIMLRTEQQQLMRNHDSWHWTFGCEPADLTIQCLSPGAAKTFFLDAVCTLTPERTPTP